MAALPPAPPPPSSPSDAHIRALLAATLLPPPSDGAAAPHAILAASELAPGFMPALFRLATSLEPHISLVAAVYLKNLVRREWQHATTLRPPPSPTLPPAHIHCTSRPRLHSRLPSDDKATLRAALVPALAVVDPRIRSQLAETLKRVIAADFPARFPELLPLILQALHAPEPRALEAGLVALRALAKVYEIKGAALASRNLAPVDADDELPEPPSHLCTATGAAFSQKDLDFLHYHPRAALNVVVRETFPRLLHVMQGLHATIDADHHRRRQGPSPAPDPTEPLVPALPLEGDVQNSLFAGDKPFEVQRTICKIFWSFTQYDLPTLLIRDLGGVFSQWMRAFLQAMRRPVLQSVTVPLTHEDELRRMPQWKVKQWIGHIVYRLFQRYSNPSCLNPSLLRNFDMDALTYFGDFFRTNFGAPFTEAMLQLLSWDSHLTSPRVANLALLYLESAVSPNITYRTIKPRLADLITKVMFPYLCISEPDLALWADEPVEYVRKTYDVLEDFNTPRAAACSLLFILSKQRRSAVVAPLLEFLTGILNAYADCRQRVVDTHGNDVEAMRHLQTLARQKDGALLAFGTIRETIMANSQNSEYLEAVLNAHVIHEFYSDFPFLRARACWLYGQLTASESVSIDIVLPGLQGVQKCLRDKEFPVRVRAAVDIRHFLQNKVAAVQIAPNLGDLLFLLFNLLDDIDNTDIVATIDQAVVGFSDEVAPYAAPLCARLVETFSRAATAGQGDDEAGFAAAQCIQALESIVSSVALSGVPNKIPLLAEIEKTIAEVFNNMFEEDRIEYFEEALELLAMFVYHSAVERGEHLRAAMEAGMEPHEDFLGLRELPEVKVAMEALKSNPHAARTMQCDVSAGGGVISPYLWSLFPRAMHAFQDWASDYSCHYMHLVDSFLSKSPRVFMSNRDGETSFGQLLLGMISRLWDDCSLEQEEFTVQGGRICGLFLQHCRNLDGISIDREVGVLTQLAVLRLRTNSQSVTAVVALVRALAHLTYASPVTTLTVIDKSLGCTEEVFLIWLDLVRNDQLESVYDRRASAIALSAILDSDWNALPKVLNQAIPQILVMVVSLLESLASKHGTGTGNNGRNRVFRSRFASDLSTEGFSSGGSGEDITTGSHRGTDPLQRITNGISAENGNAEKAVAARGNMEPMQEADEDVGYGTIEGRDIDGDESDARHEDEEDGENPMFCILDNVDELLYFESVVRRLSPLASQQLMTALAKDDTQRIQCTLHRAAELRTVQLNGVSKA